MNNAYLGALKYVPGDSYICSSFLIMTCFLIRDYNLLPKKELHRSPQVDRTNTLASSERERAEASKPTSSPPIVSVDSCRYLASTGTRRPKVGPVYILCAPKVYSICIL